MLCALRLLGFGDSGICGSAALSFGDLGSRGLRIRGFALCAFALFEEVGLAKASGILHIYNGSHSLMILYLSPL
jgi:hypothetical protein